MDDKQKQEGAAYDSNLTVEWLTWRSRFQRTMENTFNMKPSVQDVDYFMLSLLRRIEKETVEEFREPKAQWNARSKLCLGLKSLRKRVFSS